MWTSSPQLREKSSPSKESGKSGSGRSKELELHARTRGTAWNGKVSSSEPDVVSILTNQRSEHSSSSNEAGPSSGTRCVTSTRSLAGAARRSRPSARPPNHARRYLHHPPAVRDRRIELEIVSVLESLPQANAAAEHDRKERQTQVVDEACVERLAHEISANTVYSAMVLHPMKW